MRLSSRSRFLPKLCSQKKKPRLVLQFALGPSDRNGPRTVTIVRQWPEFRPIVHKFERTTTKRALCSLGFCMHQPKYTLHGLSRALMQRKAWPSSAPISFRGYFNARSEIIPPWVCHTTTRQMGIDITGVLINLYECTKFWVRRRGVCMEPCHLFQRRRHPRVRGKPGVQSRQGRPQYEGTQTKCSAIHRTLHGPLNDAKGRSDVVAGAPTPTPWFAPREEEGCVARI